MFNALSMAFADLRDSRVRRALWEIVAWCTGILVVVFIALIVGFDQADLGLWVEGRIGWLPGWLVDALAGLIVVLAYLVLIWFGFVMLAQNVAGFYLDGVVARIEELDYPGLAKAPGSSVVNDITAMVRFTAVVLALNILALPFYIAGLFFPPISLAIFYMLNGYLFGREYAEVVALRRLPQAEARAWRKANGTRVWIAGALIAFAMTLPVLNFLGPVIAAAFMTHIFHATRSRQAG